MTLPGFIVRNAIRNKRRALLSILSVAVSLFLLVTLLVGLREITNPVSDAGSAMRVIVRHKVSLGSLLPARQRPIIERIPGVQAVTPFTFFGGKYKDENFSFAQFGLDPLKLTELQEDVMVDPAQMADFLKDRTSCLVGKKVAEKYGWKVGQRLPLKGTFYTFDLDLRIAGIYSGTVDERTVFFHHKLLDELSNDWGLVGTWWVKAESLEAVPSIVTAINKAFENSSAEVRAETERAFQLGFVSMWGNIKMLIHSICVVVVFTLLLVSASTMSMAIRERFRELAVLKAIGYRRLEIFGFILAESCGLAGLGGLLGIGGAYCLYTFGDIQAWTNGMFLVLEVTPRIIGLTSLVALALGVVSSLAPAISVARMSVVEGLKTLD